MTRSTAKHDDNRVPSLIGVSKNDGDTPVPIEVNPINGAMLVEPNGLLTNSFDYIGVTYPDGVTEVYTYKSGGSGGLTVETLTVVYTDSTKANISSVTKT